jgi:hypothetical protein
MLAALASCTLILAACGGSDSSVASGGSTSQSVAPSSSSTPTSTPTQPSGPSTGSSTVVGVELSGTPSTTATAGTAYSFQPILVKGGGTVSYSITGKPNWATFSSSDGALTGTPGVDNEGTSASITISASNGSSSTSLEPFTIQVNAPPATTVGSAPTVGSATLSWGAPTRNENGTEITELAGYHIYYGTDESSLNEVITVDTAKTTTYVIKGLAPGIYYFAVVAFNALGVDSSKSNIARKTIT